MEQGTEVHVARQPIFDRNQNVFGYELLFRRNLINTYDGTDGDQATNSVISDSFLLIGIETLTNGKRAFINFTANALINKIPAMLPKDLIAVEILEDVIPNEKIISVCKQLKHDGYLLVLDDFVFRPEYMPLIRLADIIKIDFRVTPREERQQLIKHLQDYPIKFLAEKVESQEEFKEALQMGYSYFQGYFFCKPKVLTGKNIPGYKENYLHILQEINRPELDFSKIEDIIKSDISLSYKLLKYVNSSAFCFRNRITSLRQALALLGQKGLNKWISLVSLNGVADEKPGELILESLIRARFAENLASGRMQAQLVNNAFLMGMFSLIDVLLDRPLEDILEEIPLPEEIKYALLEKGNSQFSVLYKLIRTYENGDWEANSCCVNEMGIEERDVLKSYRESLIWAQDLIASLSDS